MFPEEIQTSSPVFQTILRNPDFLGRDYEVCKVCVKAGAISEEKAVILNRIVCFLYMGYFKNLMDKSIKEENLNSYVWKFVEDVERIVFHLADDLQGYKSYKKVVKRKIKWQKA